MSDLVGNPEDRFSHNEVHIIFIYIHAALIVFDLDWKLSWITLIRLCDFYGILLKILTLISTNEYPRSTFFIEKFMSLRFEGIINMGACHYDNMSMKYTSIFQDCNSDKNCDIFHIVAKTLRRFEQVPTIYVLEQN